MLTKALSDARADLAYQADIQVATGNAARHPTAQLNRLLNDSFRTYQSKISARGFTFYLLETVQASLPSSRADTNEDYSLVDWPATSPNARTIERVDVYKGGVWSSLDKVEWTHLRKYQRTLYSGSGDVSHRPLVFATKSAGSVSGATAADGSIALAPFSVGGVYKLSYLPEWSNISGDTDVFHFPDENGYQWLLWDCVVKISARDRDSRKRHQIAERERDRADIAIGNALPGMVNTGSMTTTRSPMYRG